MFTLSKAISSFKEKYDFSTACKTKPFLRPTFVLCISSNHTEVQIKWSVSYGKYLENNQFSSNCVGSLMIYLKEPIFKIQKQIIFPFTNRTTYISVKILSKGTLTKCHLFHFIQEKGDIITADVTRTWQLASKHRRWINKLLLSEAQTNPDKMK